MPNLVKQIVGSLRKRGLAETIAVSWQELARKAKESRSLDRIHGTDTSGFVPLEDLVGIGSENKKHGVQYQPTPSKLFNRVLSELEIRHQDYVFIDFGSGKGRTLLLASAYPFKRIIGVEFSPELHATALRNIAVYTNKKQRCFDIQAVHADAALYEIPSDPAVYYFFNPFDETVLSTVLTNIKRSLERQPRDAFFVYYNPVHALIFDQFDLPKERVILVDPIEGEWGDL